MGEGGNDASGLPQNGGTWKGGCFIGKGGNGWIHYWVNVDENDKVRDTMVIKDLWYAASTVEPETYRGIYEDLVRKGMDFGIAASGKSGEATVDERFFREAYLQALMTDPDNRASATTVPLRGFKKGDRHKVVYDKKGNKIPEIHWRLYMDLFYAGDLEKIITHHIGGKDRKGIPITEPFIWWVFTCIANALIQMDSMVQNRTGARAEKDETLVFIDMKALNMLLDATRGNQYPVYPKPLLSDFGSAYILHKEDPSQNSFACGATGGYFAPEMIKKDKFDGSWSQGLKKPLHSWTNVWQAGRTIESMMQLRPFVRDDHNYIGVEDCPIKDKDPPRFEAFPNFRYSDDLIDLVWRCQRAQPEQRPTPTKLLELIKQRAPKHSRGMDTWGNEEWVAQREAASRPWTRPHSVGISPLSVSTIIREQAGKLDFLDEYPDKNLANRYRHLDVDLPEGCALVYSGGRNTNKVGDLAFVPPPKQESDPMKGWW